MKKNKRSILLVEDDRDISESLQITLKLKDFEVSTLYSGKGVCDFVRSKNPDLVIMDVMMPPPDGYEVCRQLKSDEKTKHVPVILLSARTQQSEMEQGFQSGADRYMAKPFQNDELLKAVETLMARP